jgi:ribosome-binding factor A
MQEGKRQKQVAAVIQQELNDVFMRLGLNMVDGGMVSISSVKVTPDLLEARIYLSLFKVADVQNAMKKIQAQAWEVKKELSERIKHQLRRIPVLQFYHDDTLDYVFKMEDIFKQINTEGSTNDSGAKTTDEKKAGNDE